ncbi:MAG: GntR family transcriptional regulator [Clostridia bacterium]|nr:GntR family transcriptional regulator [Clostridia bacterium]
MIRQGSASLEARVYNEIREAILSEEFKKGEWLTEHMLTQKLGVSRTPVRSALQRLAEDGLVSMTPNRGAAVIGITREDLVDIYHIRMRLEGLASAMAAEKITDEQKRKLAETVELSEFYIQKQDTERIKELDTAFHRMIYEASGSRMIERILSDLHSNTKAYRRQSLCVPGRLSKTLEEHKEILNAILTGNAAEAEALTSAHIERALENMLLVLAGN